MKKKNSFVSWLKDPSWDIWLFIIVVVLANLVSTRLFFRLDLTAPHSYSLSASSKELVKNLEEPLSVKVFFSDNLPSEDNAIKDYVKDILSEYKNAANSNFKVESFDMEKAESQQQARQYGIQTIQRQEIKNNEVGFKNVYMALALTYGDQIEVLNGLTSTSGLEYKITNALSSVIYNSNALSGLKQKVQFTLYRTASLSQFGIQGFAELDSEVQKAFSTLEKKYPGLLQLEIQNPQGEEVDNLHNLYGIQVLPWRNADGTTGQGAFGFVVELQGRAKLVPLSVVNVIFSYAVQGLEGLSESMEESMKSLLSRTTLVAYSTGHGELDLSDSQSGAANFAHLFENRYEFAEVYLQNDEIPSSAGTLIVNGPKTQFSDEELYKIDQFLLKGGNLLLFLDPFYVLQPEGQSAYYEQPQFIPSNTGLESLVEKYGVRVNNEYVMDKNCYTDFDQQYTKLNFYYAPLLQKEQLAKKSPITNNLGYVIFLQSGSLDSSEAKKNPNLKVTNIARSSDESWAIQDSIILNPYFVSSPDSETSLKSYELVTMLEGSFESAFEKSPLEQESTTDSLSVKTHISKSTQNGKIIVAASSSITSPNVISENSTQPIALFLQNLLDYELGREDSCLMRTKGLSLNALRISDGAFANVIKYFNEIALALIVALVGFIVLLHRRSHRRAIRMKYNPEDSREEHK